MLKKKGSHGHIIKTSLSLSLLLSLSISLSLYLSLPPSLCLPLYVISYLSLYCILMHLAYPSLDAIVWTYINLHQPCIRSIHSCPRASRQLSENAPKLCPARRNLAKPNKTSMAELYLSQSCTKKGGFNYQQLREQPTFYIWHYLTLNPPTCEFYPV